MDDEPNVALDWTRIDTLADGDLALLTAAAINVLQELDEQPAPVDVRELPPSVIGRELAGALIAHGVAPDERTIRGLELDAGLSRSVALTILSDVRRSAPLASEIAAAFGARKSMLFVDPGTIAAAALLVLVLKLRRVRIDKGQVEVEFYELRAETIEQIRRLLGR